jgi:quercetin dioxygenase-like cupin family protein
MGALNLKLDIITFPSGVRNKLHSHSCDQVLYILSGKGIVGTEKEKLPAEPRMVFFIPRGEKHWHGAAKESTFLPHIDSRAWQDRVVDQGRIGCAFV